MDIRLCTRPLSEALGTEVLDVDLTAHLDDSTASGLRQLFASRSLLLFRGQDLTAADQRRFVETLGPISTALLPPVTDDNAEGNFYLSNDYADGRGELQPHSDHCFLDRPLWGISLYAMAVPDSGGETVYSSAAAACGHLPQDIMRTAVGKHAVHIYRARKRLGDGIRDPNLPDELIAQHPVIWTHPVTRVPVLYVNPMMTTSITELQQDESERLLEQLLEFVIHPSLTYCHTWQERDFIVWDNIALLHRRNNYDASKRRLMHRLQLALP
jgi:taurine dioxygenase